MRIGTVWVIGPEPSWRGRLAWSASLAAGSSLTWWWFRRTLPRVVHAQRAGSADRIHVVSGESKRADRAWHRARGRPSALRIGLADRVIHVVSPDRMARDGYPLSRGDSLRASHARGLWLLVVERFARCVRCSLHDGCLTPRSTGPLARIRSPRPVNVGVSGTRAHEASGPPGRDSAAYPRELQSGPGNHADPAATPVSAEAS